MVGAIVCVVGGCRGRLTGGDRRRVPDRRPIAMSRASRTGRRDTDPAGKLKLRLP